MKQFFFKLPAIRKELSGWMIYKANCKLTAWGIAIGSWRLQWRDTSGWCWRVGI